MNTIIAEKLWKCQQKNSRIDNFFKEFGISMLMKRSNFQKSNGCPAVDVLKYLFDLVFEHSSIYLDSVFFKKTGLSKNTAYRFMNSPYFNWVKLLYLTAIKFIKMLLPLTSEKRVNCLIFDDTLYSRSRSKSVDMLTRVFDHVTNKYVKGFKLLTCAWTDGNSTVPVMFRPLVSLNPDMIINSIPENMDKRRNSYKIRKSAQMPATDAMFEILEKIELKLMDVRYVLFDSWFSFPSIISKVCTYGVNVICAVKKMPLVRYGFRGKTYNLKQIYEMLDHKKDIITASAMVSITNQNGGKHKAKIVFVRTNKSTDDWYAILSTDTELSDEEIVRIYGKRWNIEVCFKICKHYLKLDTEYEGRSFESLYAHSAIVFLRYIMLSHENRISEDPRTCGQLFFLMYEELKDISYSEAVIMLISTVLDKANSDKIISDEQLDSLVDIFMASIPDFICFYHG